MPDKLPDLLCPGLKLVICGSAAGTVSAARGAYYAGPGNRFWPIMFAIGLTPRLLQPGEFTFLLTLGIGLTDVAKVASGADDELPVHTFDRDRLIRSISDARPGNLAFNGKKAASVFLDIPTARIAYGSVHHGIRDFPPITVLPSTSGAASRYWNPSPWHTLARGIVTSQ